MRTVSINLIILNDNYFLNIFTTPIKQKSLAFPKDTRVNLLDWRSLSEWTRLIELINYVFDHVGCVVHFAQVLIKWRNMSEITVCKEVVKRQHLSMQRCVEFSQQKFRFSTGEKHKEIWKKLRRRIIETDDWRWHT